MSAPQSIPKTAKKGKLAQAGYTAKDDTHVRQKALADAIEKHSKPAVTRMLHAVSTLNKKRAPHVTAVLEEDKQWVHENY